jgi:hypothetical protein
MVELPHAKSEYLGRGHDGHDFRLRLTFGEATVDLPLRVTASDMAIHGPAPKADPGGWATAACLWVERKFHGQFSSRLESGTPVLEQVQAWRAELPLYLHFAE